MGIWETFFGKAQVSDEFGNRLHKKISSLIPNENEQQQLNIACIAGLLASVAFVDFEIAPGEKESIIDALNNWSELSQEDSTTIATLAIEEIKDLSGLENHLYCYPLCENLSKDERYQLLKTLFAVAASDGGVEHRETEEIRQITTSLLLEHKHFISARASVLDKLDILKN